MPLSISSLEAVVLVCCFLVVIPLLYKADQFSLQSSNTGTSINVQHAFAELSHASVWKAFPHDFREMFWIHAGHICTQHCIWCIMTMNNFNDSIQTHIMNVDFINHLNVSNGFIFCQLTWLPLHSYFSLLGGQSELLHHCPEPCFG
ncbi:hypothetical protein AMECASPLE_032552 [Ameca splendens]|uniref:Uncharacterized protein n=1 Tax=Ameca splendens TaxID=208324 RepID=A0ABV0YU47_9TELE